MVTGIVSETYKTGSTFIQSFSLFCFSFARINQETETWSNHSGLDFSYFQSKTSTYSWE